MEYRGRGHAAAPPTKIAGRVVDAAFGGPDRRDVGPYLVAQVVGCVAGEVLANGMFELAAVRIFPPPPRRDRAPRRRCLHRRRLLVHQLDASPTRPSASG